MFPKPYILRNFFKRLALFTVFSGSRAATVPLPTAQGEAASHHSAAATCRSRPSQASAGITVGRLSCGWQTATLRNILTSSCAILCCFAPTVLLPANMRKMSTERSRRAQNKQNKQTTLCPETNLLSSRGKRSRLGRKLSPTAPEHCYSCLVALLQRLRKVAPKPPEKAYSPLRKNSKLRKTMTAKLLRGCCKAVTYVGLLARQKPPTHISGKRKPQGEACRYPARNCNLTERELVLARKAAKKPLLATSQGRKASTKGSSARLSTWFSTLKQQFPGNSFSALLFYNCCHPTTLPTQKGEPRGPPLLSCFGLAVGSRWLPMPTCASSERA